METGLDISTSVSRGKSAAFECTLESEADSLIRRKNRILSEGIEDPVYSSLDMFFIDADMYGVRAQSWFVTILCS